MLRWFEEPGVRDDVIISSRIRLARNISEYPFSIKMNSEMAERMLSYAGKIMLKLPEISAYRDYILEDLDETQKGALVERNVISNYLANQDKAMFFVSEDEKNTIMFNEEDHIRIQCIDAGMNLKVLYERISRLDDLIGNNVLYAYDDNFGYLTTCPSNVGTGMKASCILHLPALVNTKKIQNLITEVGHFGINMKGLYGEDGSGCGHMYQVSNQKTMGQSEDEIISSIENIAKQISGQERECRKQIMKNDRIKLEDEVYKSYGILKFARRLKYKDAMLFLSELRLGVSSGIMKFQEGCDIIVYQLMMGIQPSNLKAIAGRNLTEGELEELRAEFIRENLPLIN